MLGLRTKLSLGFGGLLAIILVTGVQSIVQVTRLGMSIVVILRENYRSVIACQEMKEALERIDSGILFTLLGHTEQGRDLIRAHETAFQKARQAGLLVAAREESDRLHNILDNLLDISRMESGRVQMEFGPVSPRGMVLEALEPFKMSVQDHGLALQVELADDLPDVLADTTRVHHVFENLLSNAIRYTSPGGGITISARTDQDVVSFSITDTGQGIPSRYLARVFEPFFRVPDQGTQTGAGLGLAIVKEIVRAHGETVSVESEEGKGTTFTLRRAERVSKEEDLS